MKAKLLNLAKVGFIALAFYIISQKVDVEKLMQSIRALNLWYALLALAFYNISMGFSALRLEAFIKALNVPLTPLYNLKLYYVGMFYNTFLPGGIGGDGYKVYKLNKHHEKGYKALIKALLIDRFNGLFGLMVILGFFLINSAFNESFALTTMFGLLLIIFAPIMALIMHSFFDVYKKIYFKTLSLSLVAQIFQALTVVAILYGLGEQRHIQEFVALLLISSIVAVIPLSVGGVGIRELTFLYGLELMGQESTEIGVLTAFIFFILTLISSLFGALYLKRV